MMKNLFILFVLISSLSFAQTGINYQGAATDADGTKLVNQNISLKTSVLQGGVDGTTSYSEIHNTTTDQFGLFNVVIGQGVSISGDFETISWGSGNHFLKVELDATGGTNYSLVSTTQMMSVPYALYAKNAGLDSSAVADMLASMNISANSGGCDYRFPDGLNGTPVIWHLPGNDYTVPEGKNLYITSYSGYNIGDYMQIDGLEIINDNDFEEIIIVGPGSVVSTNSNTSTYWANFNGILVEENVTPIIWHLPGNDYTVPEGKNLYITSYSGHNIGDYMQIDGLEIINDNDFEEIIIVGSGSVVSTSSNTSAYWANFNGYLVDEDYFADCGGGGGNFSSTPSSIDSAMVADMIEANTSSGSGSDWELLYDELNTNNDEPYGTVNRYGIAQSDGFLYLVGSYATVYTGNDHDTITNTWPENPILQNISANDPNEAHIIPLKKNMSWHIEFHSTLGYITKGYFIPNGGGSASLANAGMSGISKSFKYPDGMHGTPITIAVGTDNSYTVPEGKNLYANYFRPSSGGNLYVDGVRVAISYNNLTTENGSDLLYVGEGQTITCDNNLDINEMSTLNGFLTDKSVDMVSFGIGGDLNNYTVPIGKNLYVNYFRPSSGGSLYIDGIRVATSYNNFTTNKGSDLLYVGEGQTITCDNNLDINEMSTLNGYLADLDYFESSSSSSASNSEDGGNSDVQMTVSTFGDTLTIGDQSVIIPGISFENNTPEFGTVTDIDGNVYQTVNINGNEWMTEDLKVTKFNNGDELTYHDFSPPGNAWNYWENTPTYVSDQEVYNSSFDGVFYNGVTIQDSRNICPQGWSIPSEDDFIAIMNIFGNQILTGDPNNISFSSASSFKSEITLINDYWSPSESTNSSFLSFFPTGYKQNNSINTYGENKCYIFIDDGQRAFTLSQNDDFAKISGITYYNLYKARCVKD